MRRLHCALLGLLVAVGVTACDDSPLEVDNPNNPDREGLLASPATVEKLIVDAYNIVHQATLGSATVVIGAGSPNDALEPQLIVLGMESYSGNSNFGMATRGAIPRNQINNSRGNAESLGNYRDWLVLNRAARMAASGLARLRTPGFSLGGPGADLRGRAFGKFVLGIALGNLALAYDSVAVVSETDDPTQINYPLVGYNQAMQAAIANLDSAVIIAGNTAMSALPQNWLNAESGFATRTDFIRLVRSYRARYRATVARTAAERAAADWQAVMADAENGIQTPYRVVMTPPPAGAWDVSWVIQHYLFQSWTQGWSLILGMADVSGNYNNWLGLSTANKAPFVIVTPDRRFPQGTTRAEQNTASNVIPGVPPDTLIYWRNRPPGEDVLSTNTFANSLYDHFRFQAFRNASRNGPYPIMVPAEIDMYRAEGAIRRGQFDVAMMLINRTRVRNGLEALAGISDLNTPVPGGSNCVPKVPAPPSFNTATCGNVMEAMKWEYRMETAHIHYGAWYFFGRGLQDLPEGTPIHWPVPWQEMDTRTEVGGTNRFYNMGGVGRPGGAPRGTYGI